MSVEFVLWVPILMGIICFTVDATMVMHTRTVLFDAARDAARQVAVGNRSPADAKANAVSRFGNDGQYQAEVDIQNGFVTARLGVPVSEVVVFGESFIKGPFISADVTMYIETGI